MSRRDHEFVKLLATRQLRSGHRALAEYELETWDNDSEFGQLLTVDQPSVEDGRPRSVSVTELATARSLAFEALEHVIAGRSDEALRCSSRAADLAPGDSAVLCTRARVLAEMGSMEAAEAFARSAVMADSSGIQPRLHLARVLVQQGRLDEAENEAAVVQAIDASHPEALSLIRLIDRFRDFRSSVEDSKADDSFSDASDPGTLSTLNPVLWALAATFCAALLASVAYHAVLLAQGQALTATMMTRFVLALPTFGYLAPRLARRRPF